MVLPGEAVVKVVNPVGIRVFALLDGARPISEIARIVSEEYDVDPQQALSDVLGFVDELEQNGMLDTGTGAAREVTQ